MSDSQQQSSPPESNASRRDVLKLGAALVGAVGLAQFISLETLAGRQSSGGEGPSEGPQWGMAIDINKCIGCNYCTYACQAVNNLADDMRYNRVTVETTKSGQEFFLSRPCMHCQEAPCVHVCPVQATWIRPDGIVAMDYTRCIGCRYCQVACPYDARVFNWKEPIEKSPQSPTFGLQEVENRPRGVVEKCTFCTHRVDYGLENNLTVGVDTLATPACVVACPTHARAFGDLTDPESPVSKMLNEARTSLRLREELSTEPRVFYIPPETGRNNPFQGS